MKPIPKNIRKQISKELEAAKCARIGEGTCSGKITVEHAFGRIKQPRWSLVFLCWYHHLGAGLNKELNKHLAYSQVTEKEIKETWPKTYEIYLRERDYLKQKYGGKVWGD